MSLFKGVAFKANAFLVKMFSPFNELILTRPSAPMPFFTTKKGGQGIGLVFVREVLQRHGLPYRLASTNDQQSCFEIWFGS